MKDKYIISIDQGTTSSLVAVLDYKTNILETFTHEFKQIISDDKVLQDVNEIYKGLKNILDEAIDKYGKENIVAIGITNQRETTVVFDKLGNPLTYAIGWQSKHTKEICETWQILGYEPYVKKLTGLPINPYFSASKMAYFLQDKKIKDYIDDDNALFGTMDTYLLYKLTNGKSFYTDVTNASRTMLFDIHKGVYDKKLLEHFMIPEKMLAEVKPNIYDFGSYRGIPIKAMIGDQQSALFGHLAFERGSMKATYGTGAFILMNTGNQVYDSKKGLISTIAYQIGDKPTYALEGSIFVAGSSINWLKEQLCLIDETKESEDFANKSKTEIYFVPAFVGLGAPHWDSDVRGAMFGITAEVNKYDIVKATLDAIGYQVKDVVDVMIKESKIPLKKVYIDGGVTNNDYLMQFQADLLRCPLIKPINTEITAIGAGYLAGLGTIYKDLDYLIKHKEIFKEYNPLMPHQEAISSYKGWQKAVKSAQSYKKDK